MAPPFQTLSILLHLLLAGSKLVTVVGSAELVQPPSGYRLQLTRRSPLKTSSSICYSDYEYFMKFKIGDSLVSAIIDTGSDLIWTNHSQLMIDSYMSRPCDSTKKNSDCCHELCMYTKKYGDGSVATGAIVEASLTFEEPGNTYKTRALNIGAAMAFGCHSPNEINKQNCELYRAGGVVGLGRGKLSLMSQLGLSSFSYCLTDYYNPDQTSQIELGLPLAALPAEGMQKIKLVKIDRHQSKYYVKLNKILIGDKDLEIPQNCFKLDESNGDGGMFIDTGSSFTRLPKEALDKVTEHLDSLINHSKIPKNDSKNKDFTCYRYAGKELPKERLPDMELQFDGYQGQEARMVLPMENYMILDHDDKELCLAIKEAHKELPWQSILGNFQQQNIYMFFDIGADVLSFVKRTCSERKHAAV